MKLEKRNYPYVLGHRGASGYAPENTLESFKMAIDMNADGVELDVQLTKDGQVVVCHDETIDRTSDHKGRVQDYTLEELKKFNFNKGMKEFPFCVIPTFKEVLDLFKPTKCVINVELKTGVYEYKGIEEKTLNLVKEAGMEDRVFYSSFNFDTCDRIRAIDPNAYIGLLYENKPEQALKRAIVSKANALHPHYIFLYNKDYMRRVKEAGLETNVWTTNSTITLKKMAKMNVTSVIGNYPDRSIKICRKKD